MINVGIIIRQLDKLCDYELNIIEMLITHVNINVSLIISISENQNLFHTTSKMKSYLKRLLKLQIWVEEKAYRLNTPDRSKLIADLKMINHLNINIDKIAQTDIENIRKYDLDVLLSLCTNDLLKFDPFNSSRHGIWSLRLSKYALSSVVPIGFSEIISDDFTVDVSLFRLRSSTHSSVIIGDAYYSTQYSAYITEKIVQYSLPVFVVKHIKELAYSDKSDHLPYIDDIAESKITLSKVIKYATHFYLRKAYSLFQKPLVKFFNYRKHCWNLFIGEGSILKNKLLNIKELNLHKNKYWADPFLFEYEGEVYIFFEEYDYLSKKGNISCGKLVNNELCNVRKVLNFDHHLSNPYIFQENGDIFMIPECSEMKEVRIFKCTKFPDKWELYSHAFNGETIVDISYYVDSNNDKWLFLNKGNDNQCSELYIYKIDSLKLLSIESHKKNPVIIDSRVARNAGLIFEKDGNVYRPSQINVKGTYGYGLNINKIIHLSIDEYKEENILSFDKGLRKNIIGMHHLCQCKDLFVIDGCYDVKF